MRLFRKIPAFAVLVGLCLPLPTLAQSVRTSVPLEGRVLDAASGQPVPLATVWAEDVRCGAAADVEGRFTLRLAPGPYTLRVSAVGYEAARVRVEVPRDEPLDVHLRTSVVPMEEVIVSESAATGDLAAPQENLGATEDLLQRVGGVGLIQRANFAWEPAIRGMSGGQVGLVIDGMKVYGACVDKMDPASSYVEPENLEKVEVTKGAFDLTRTSQIGGTVNLVTEKPDFSRPYALMAETGYETVAALRRVRLAGGAARGRFAVRGSVSYRKAGDFAPGGREAVDYSGFEKRNYKASLAARLAEGHRLTASFLGDDAWNVGYPVLLMDATLAQARLYSLAYEGTPDVRPVEQIEARLYHNRVDHWMDDRHRDVMAREVMRGMYMPMYGNTRTWGGLARLHAAFGENRLGLTLDLHRVGQFGDMWMYSLFPNIPDMYLLNVGDVVATNAAATLAYQRPLTDRLRLRTDVRLDLSWRDARREAMASIFRSRYGLEDLARRYRLLSASATLTYAVGPVTRLRLALARAARLPTNVENYGHYVYNYVDGYFYTGDPGLAPERSRQVEVGLEHTTGRLGLRLAAFYHHLRDYIIGTSDAGIGSGLGGRTSAYRFRVYANAERAYLTGGEASALVMLGSGWEAATSVSYTHGHNRTLGEPLPMIPPLGGSARLRHEHGTWWAEAESRWAIAQNRVSLVSDEDATDGFNVVGVRAGWRVTSELELKAGVENVFDAFYHEHLAIGNLPGRGRNAFAALALAL